MIGPVGTSTYRLALPPSMYIHPMFHVSLLEPHVANMFPDRVVVPPFPIQVDGLPKFEFTSKLDSRFHRKKLQYLVDCMGYDPSKLSWQPAPNVSNARLAIHEFHTRFPAKPRPRA